ncbi:MAG: PepSY domain-containing protein [Mangrovibacterium sp.]
MQKIHRWAGLIMAFFLIILASSGIVLNHREFFAHVDVDRDWLPDEYAYSNWNNASVKGNFMIGSDSILIYGNVGLWLSDSTFSSYQPFDNGFPSGIDFHKITDAHKTKLGNLYASTLWGVYAYDYSHKCWSKLNITGDDHFVAIESRNDRIFLLSRSFLYEAEDHGIHSQFSKTELLAPQGYVSEVSLFQTIWQIHSGELFGLFGKIVVDLLAVITLILSLTGIIYFIFPPLIRHLKRRGKSFQKLAIWNRISLKWHNKLGAWTFLLIAVCFLTGMFLRPPLLLTIASKKVKPVKFTHLDQNNPWHDKLRDFVFDSRTQQFIISTSEGMYWLNPTDFSTFRCESQAPVSVMGITCFEHFQGGTYLVGSFSGLFLWNPSVSKVVDFVSGQPAGGFSMGPPVGATKVSGLLANANGYPFICDYEFGALPLHHQQNFPTMPEELQNSPISLWNFALEFHTLRVFQSLLGQWYMLLIPLVGLTALLVLISGYIYWRKRYRKTKN